MTVEHDLTDDEQVVSWVAGRPLHRRVASCRGGVCCSDFSSVQWILLLMDAVKGMPVRPSAHLCYDRVRRFLTEVVEVVHCMLIRFTHSS